MANGLPGGLIIYQGHLFAPKKDTYNDDSDKSHSLPSRSNHDLVVLEAKLGNPTDPAAQEV